MIDNSKRYFYKKGHFLNSLRGLDDAVPKKAALPAVPFCWLFFPSLFIEELTDTSREHQSSLEFQNE